MVKMKAMVTGTVSASSEDGPALFFFPLSPERVGGRARAA